jgi:hypothetical protein
MSRVRRKISCASSQWPKVRWNVLVLTFNVQVVAAFPFLLKIRCEAFGSFFEIGVSEEGIVEDWVLGLHVLLDVVDLLLDVELI